MDRSFDMLVIGAGPGGCTAALYAAQAGLSVLLLEKLSAGGQMALTDRIDNYPGFPEGTDGFTLGQQLLRQAERSGVRTVLTEVTALELTGQMKQAVTGEGNFYGKTAVIATGAEHRELGLPGERALTGRGVHYCAACDGMLYRDKTVAVIGGGNSAAAEALHLSRIARRVILIHRRDRLRAAKSYQDALMRAGNVEFMWDSQVVRLLGEDRLTGIRVKNTVTGAESTVSCDGVFVSIGRSPATGPVRGQLPLDEGGYIPAGESTRTGIPGVFAVGDVRAKALRQIVTAMADGAAAAQSAQEYLAEQKGEQQDEICM